MSVLDNKVEKSNVLVWPKIIRTVHKMAHSNVMTRTILNLLLLMLSFSRPENFFNYTAYMNFVEGV